MHLYESIIIKKKTQPKTSGERGACATERITAQTQGWEKRTHSLTGFSPLQTAQWQRHHPRVDGQQSALNYAGSPPYERSHRRLISANLQFMPPCAQEPSVPSIATETNAEKKGGSCKLATSSCHGAKSRGIAGVQQTLKGQAELDAEHRGSKVPCTPSHAPSTSSAFNWGRQGSKQRCQLSTGILRSQPSTSPCPLQQVYGLLRS